MGKRTGGTCSARFFRPVIIHILPVSFFQGVSIAFVHDSNSTNSNQYEFLGQFLAAWSSKRFE